jgi:hypothetical protein
MRVAPRSLRRPPSPTTNGGHVTNIISTDSNNDTVDSFTYAYNVDPVAIQSDSQGEQGPNSLVAQLQLRRARPAHRRRQQHLRLDADGNRDTGYTYVRNGANTHDTNLIEDDGT